MDSLWLAAMVFSFEEKQPSPCDDISKLAAIPPDHADLSSHTGGLSLPPPHSGSSEVLDKQPRNDTSQEEFSLDIFLPLTLKKISSWALIFL